jgi:hypothetical protein
MLNQAQKTTFYSSARHRIMTWCRTLRINKIWHDRGGENDKYKEMDGGGKREGAKILGRWGRTEPLESDEEGGRHEGYDGKDLEIRFPFWFQS